MTSKPSLAVALFVQLVAAAASAQSIRFVDDFVSNTATLQVVTESAGFFELEIGVLFEGSYRLVGSPTINTATFDQPLSAENIFSPGQQVEGLAIDETDRGWAFAAYAGDLSLGSHDFLSFSYDPLGIEVDCLVSFRGVTAGGTFSHDGAMPIPVYEAFGYFADYLGVPDANLDCRVDLVDLDILGLNFGKSPAEPEEGDFNGDRRVDLFDLDLLGMYFGQGTSHAAAVPEASAIWFALLGCLAVIRR